MEVTVEQRKEWGGVGWEGVSKAEESLRTL